MKKINYLLVILFLFIACKKDPAIDTSVSGKWEWFKTQVTGITLTPEYTPQSTGRSWTLILNTNLTFTQSGDFLSSMGLPNSAIIGAGSYSLANVRQINSSQIGGEIMIPFLGGFAFLKNSQDTLYLDQYLAADGVAHFFVRK
jgi:hypothetical protein